MDYLSLLQEMQKRLRAYECLAQGDLFLLVIVNTQNSVTAGYRYGSVLG